MLMQTPKTDITKLDKGRLAEEQTRACSRVHVNGGSVLARIQEDFCQVAVLEPANAVGEIISEWWATSFRNRGRVPPGISILPSSSVAFTSVLEWWEQIADLSGTASRSKAS